MEFRIPVPLKAEHDQLHRELVAATKAPGRVGEAARAVAGLLHPHFVKEEEFALPPLGLLSTLARGEVVPGMEPVTAMTDRLEAELPAMLAEHQAIVAALEELTAAARDADDAARVEFAEKLSLHARTEEEVLYPAAILVGRWVKAQLARGKRSGRVPSRGSR